MPVITAHSTGTLFEKHARIDDGAVGHLPQLHREQVERPHRGPRQPRPQPHAEKRKHNGRQNDDQDDDDDED